LLFTRARPHFYIVACPEGAEDLVQCALNRPLARAARECGVQFHCRLLAVYWSGDVILVLEMSHDFTRVESFSSNSAAPESRPGKSSAKAARRPDCEMVGRTKDAPL